MFSSGGERVFLSLGSNAGDSRTLINEALKGIAALDGTAIAAVSPLYLSKPVDMPHCDDWFINCAAEIATALAPLELLDRLEAIEKTLGRGDKGKNAPRTIDIDILLYGEMTMLHPRLLLPHPRMAGRRFVLEPLAEIAPDTIHPVAGVSIAALSRGVTGQEVIRTEEKPQVPPSAQFRCA